MQRSYNTNVFLSISDFHQKYIEVKTPRRSGWISNILSNKKLKSNLSSYQVYAHINNQKLILPSNYYFYRAGISVGLCPSFTQNLFTLSWETIYTRG